MGGHITFSHNFPYYEKGYLLKDLRDRVIFKNFHGK